MQGWPTFVAGSAPENVLIRCPLSRAIGRGLEFARTVFCRRALKSMILSVAITGLFGRSL